MIAFEYGAFEVLLGSLLHLSDLVEAVEAILCVVELNLAVAVVVESAHRQIVKCVFRMIADYSLSIVELYLFMAYLIHFDVRYRKRYLALVVSRVPI